MQRHLNTIDEMAQRLRSCGRWDTTLADRVISLMKYLEDEGDLPFHASEATKKIHDGTYEASRSELCAVTSYRAATLPADIASCLTMAVLLSRWQDKGVEPPVVRLGSGYVVAEWDGKAGGHVMIRHGSVFWECAPEEAKL